LIKLSDVDLPSVIKEQDFDVILLNVQPIGDPDLYDFWSQEAIISGQNYGGWNNRRASEALEVARKLTLPEERKPYYEAFLKQFNADLPAVTLFRYIKTQAVSEDVLGIDIGKVNSPRDRFATFSEWSLIAREVASACPDVDM
jgi:ABC-type transport system substrate-binding protein